MKFMFAFSCVSALGSCVVHDPLFVVLNTLWALYWLSEIERVRS